MNDPVIDLLGVLDLTGVTGPLGDHLPRPQMTGDEPLAAVREIIERVARGGDQALLELTERFDRVALESLTVPAEEIAAARSRLAPELVDSFELAARRIARFHELQVTSEHVTDHEGMTVRAWDQPVARAGCYVPGGRASYPSTVLMTAVVAKVAGVDEVVLVVPPGPDGRVPDEVLVAADIAGVTEIHPVGGAQAVAALAHGTESIAPVDVIVGPGNIYVSLAKREVAGLVGVPSSFPGPSEVVVVADHTVAPELAAIDLILQAEHGPDGLAWLVCWDRTVADAVAREVARLVDRAPRRDEIISTLSVNGRAVICADAHQAVEVVNFIAAEHVELLGEGPEALVDRIRNAGAIFSGVNAPASFGDYLAGPSHVLPTHGSARFSSALSVADFTKHMHVVTVSPEALDTLGPHVVRMATAEGLHAHADSISLRLDRSGAEAIVDRAGVSGSAGGRTGTATPGAAT